MGRRFVGRIQVLVSYLSVDKYLFIPVFNLLQFFLCDTKLAYLFAAERSDSR